MSDYYDKWDKLTDKQKSRLFSLENDMRFSSAESITCPYCDMEQVGIEYSDLPFEQDEEVTFTCTHYDCKHEFVLTAQVMYSWDTKVPDDEAMKILQEEIKAEEQHNG